MNILKGNKDALSGIGSGKVIDRYELTNPLMSKKILCVCCNIRGFKRKVKKNENLHVAIPNPLCIFFRRELKV